MKNDIYCTLYQILYNLAALLDEFDGILVRRGTLVEKHWFKGITIVGQKHNLALGL